MNVLAYRAIASLTTIERATISVMSRADPTKSSLPLGDDAKANIARECHGKESFDYLGRNNVSDRIIPHIMNLYGSCATAQDFEIYTPDATFEDPLMRAHGVKQIKSAFYSLSKVFSESKIVEYTVEEKTTSNGNLKILIDNKQYYKCLGRDINMISLITLYVENGKVVRHEDWWDKKPFRSRENSNISIIGSFTQTLKRGSMLATHALMGFGKDPTGSSA